MRLDVSENTDNSVFLERQAQDWAPGRPPFNSAWYGLRRKTTNMDPQKAVTDKICEMYDGHRKVIQQIHEKVGAQRLWDLFSAVRPLDNYSQKEQLLLQKPKNTNILKYNCSLQTYKSRKIFSHTC